MDSKLICLPIFKKNKEKRIRVCMDLRDALPAAETFVYIYIDFEQCLKAQNLDITHLNITKLHKVTNFNVIFYLTGLFFYLLDLIYNSTQSPAQPRNGLFDCLF